MLHKETNYYLDIMIITQSMHKQEGRHALWLASPQLEGSGLIDGA